MARRPPVLFILDDLLRRGKLTAVRRELKAVSRRKLPREWSVEVASLAWRARLPEMGMRLLARSVRSPQDVPLKQRALPMEKVIYAGCLIQLGAVDEARLLLDSVDPEACPFALFVKMTALVSRWEYAAAIPVIEAYLRLKPDPYRVLVARVNLAASYVFEAQTASARNLIEALESELAPTRNGRLLAYVHELASLLAWEERDLARMRERLARAEEILAGGEATDALMRRKWEAVLELTEKTSAVSLKKLHAVKKTAQRQTHWETVRDCDMFEAVLTRNERLLHHVYFGTPFENYRRRLLVRYERPGPIPDRYDWELGRVSARAPSLNLANPEGAYRRFLAFLACDFYRPQTMGALHARLYPRDFFNPDSAPLKIRQLILRVRRWCAAEKIPVKIQSGRDGYRLQATSPLVLTVGKTIPDVSEIDPDLGTLEQSWGGRVFSLKDAQRTLNRPERTVRRILKDAFDAGKLERSGAARGVRYRFR